MSYDSLLVLGIDLEGINKDLIDEGVLIDVDRVIEIGAVLWDTARKQPLKILSELINENDRLKITQELEDLTGISEKILNNFGLQGDDIKETLKRFTDLAEKADYYMAHNANKYDKPMLEALFRRFDMKLPDRPWIDTAIDIEFPKRIQHKTMPMLEHAHGFINPFPHRAVTDVLSMLKIASEYSISRMGVLSKSPMITIIANLNAPNWRDSKQVAEFNKVKNKVSRARFRWDSHKKTWSKKVHKILLDEGKLDFDFDWYQSDEK